MSLPSLNLNLGKVSLVDRMLVTRRLAVMLKAGLPLLESLAVLAEQATNPGLVEVLKDISASIRNGQSLKKSLAKHPKMFDPLYISLVGVGEESGNLEGNLEYLATEMTKVYEFRRRVKGAMLYPTFVMITALVVGSGISLFVLPKLTDLFMSMDIELPFTTKVIMWLANLMKNYGGLVVGGMFALVFGFILWSRTIGKNIWQRLILKIPMWGKMLAEIQMAYFGRNLGLMIKSGLPLSDALTATITVQDNVVFKDYVTNLKTAVEKGQSLEKELTSKTYKYFPLMATRMIGVGERTGKLDETLLYIGDYYQDEVDSQTKNLTAVMEPIMLVIIAGVVLFLAMGIISPIYQFTGSVKR